MDEAKAGVKTTEFWVAVVGAIAAAAQGFGDESDAVKIAALLVAAVLGAAYVGSRALVKSRDV